MGGRWQRLERPTTDAIVAPLAGNLVATKPRGRHSRRILVSAGGKTTQRRADACVTRLTAVYNLHVIIVNRLHSCVLYFFAAGRYT